MGFIFEPDWVFQRRTSWRWRWSVGLAKNLFTSQFRWLSALPLLVVIAAMAMIAISTLANAESRNGGAREDLFDFFARISPAEDAPSPFHVVTIDEESVKRVGPWPWPRSLIAELVDGAGEAGAKAVVYVEPIDVKDPLSPETIGEFWLSGRRDDALARQLALLPGTDLMLARSLSGVEGAVAIAPNVGALRLARADAQQSALITIEGSRSDYLALPGAALRNPIKDALSSAATVTVASLPVDRDGVFRASPLLWSVNGAPAPSTALEAARLASDGAAATALAAPTGVSTVGQTIDSVALGDRRFAVDDMTSLRFYPPRKLNVAATPAWRILQTESPGAQIAGKVVLIGVDKNVGAPVRAARGSFAPVELHALLASQVYAGAGAKRPGWIGYLEALGVMIFGAAAVMWSQRQDFWRAVAIAVFASGALFAMSFAAFSQAHLLVDPIPASLALFLGAFSVAGGRSLGVVLKDDSVRGSFQGTLPEDAMKKLREDGATEILNGVRRDVTILACELSILDEDLDKLADRADEVANVIAAACQNLKSAIIETGGAAEQAEGGKVYAYFNAPLQSADHVRTGCSAALRLVESMDKINAELDASSRLSGVQVHLAIGVATGECFAGPMGHGRSNRYSVIGQPVEMAAFLRRQAIKYGPAIICDEPVYRRTHHHFAFLELDRLRPHGQDRAFAIHALVGNPFLKSSKGYRSLEDAHRKMLAAYRDGDFNAARNYLAEARRSPGAKIALFDLYEERLNHRSGAEAPSNWDGVQSVTI